MIVNRERGFTLIEVLMAMTLFAMLMSVVYAALGPAGEGFLQLQEVRDRLERSYWLGRQLRMDVSYATATHDQQLKPLRISHDARGDAVFDEMWLLVREQAQPSITYVHYFIDEESGQLVRESRMAWARSTVEAIRWELGEADSFDVELLNRQGKWVQRWQDGGDFVWPKAVRVTLRNSQGERSWDMPLYVGQQ